MNLLAGPTGHRITRARVLDEEMSAAYLGHGLEITGTRSGTIIAACEARRGDREDTRSIGIFLHVAMYVTFGRRTDESTRLPSVRRRKCNVVRSFSSLIFSATMVLRITTTTCHPPDADADGAQAPPSASAEEMRKLLKPSPSEGEVLAALSRTYPTMNLNIVRELESYDDKNYLVQDAANDGTKYLAKIHNGVESLDYINKISSPNCRTSVIDLQNAIFSHLDAVNGVTTSVSVPPTVAEDGAVVSLHDLPVMSPAHSPSKLVVRLLTWVPGVPLSSVPSTSLTAESLADAGAYLGRLRRSLDDLAQTNANAVQASKRYHEWDGRNTLGLNFFTQYIADEDRRGLVTSVLHAFRDTFGEDGSKVDFPMGILMGDYNDANIIIDGGKVSGVIDFGDSVHR